MTLRYPIEIGGAVAPDYIQFVPMEYRANNATVAGAGGRNPGAGGNRGGGAPRNGAAQEVILYMPESTPSIGNPQSWNQKDFMGPLGTLQKLYGAGIANTVAQQENLDPRALIDNFKNQVKNLAPGGKGQGGPAVKQLALDALAGPSGATGAQLLAMARGETYNPNTELLYSAPGLRAFNFTFRFVPKSAAETNAVNTIIRNFKKWSAPAELQNGMLEIPHVWKIDYMTGGQPNDNMNKFKHAACTSVSVQANPGTAMHTAFEDGMPVETVMSLSFQEVDIVLRADHDEGNQGF